MKLKGDMLAATGQCSSAVQTLLGTGLKFGANSAYLVGEATIKNAANTPFGVM